MRLTEGASAIAQTGMQVRCDGAIVRAFTDNERAAVTRPAASKVLGAFHFNVFEPVTKCDQGIVGVVVDQEHQPLLFIPPVELIGPLTVHCCL